MEGVCEDRDNLQDFLQEADLHQYHDLFRDILKVTKVSQLKFVLTEDLAHIGLSKPEQRRYKKNYSKYFPNPYISKIKKLLTSSKRGDVYAQSPGSIPLEISPFGENNVKLPNKHIIPVEDITINKELGMGQFGVVQQGTWTTGNQRLQVAIKCLGQERMTSNSNEFLKEAAVMHSIEHPSIVRLYGVVLDVDSLMLVTELAPLRSLLECLREVSLRPNFPVRNLCDFAEQICAGMTYLENKRLIHRDLAARNILVFNKDKVKISDFGLSRALGVGKDYYQTNYNVNLKLPVAWCAPECILFLRFTSASDMWAFGVCLWEMFTYGFQPWAAFSGHEILESIDEPNFRRLERPECCPEAYYTTMLECWSHEPSDRPKFKDLEIKLRDIRPEQVQAVENYKKSEDARRKPLLEYKVGQIITVLGKENMTNSSMWYGVLNGGACGIFDPQNTRPYVANTGSGRSAHSVPASPRPGPPRAPLLRTDVKRHTYTGKRTIQRSMISSPQGEVKHTGHVGLDGAYFGDISFLDVAGCPPRREATSYKPSEDLEQTPLINPNSPSHLSANATPYPLLSGDTRGPASSPGESGSKGRLKKYHVKQTSEPTTSKSILSKMKSATLGRSHNASGSQKNAVDGVVHEYQEISAVSDLNIPELRIENVPIPESPAIPKNYGDFSQSLLEEMESMFRTLDGRGRRDEHVSSNKVGDIDSVMRSHTLSKAEKKGQYMGTMKPMSAHDQKTLDSAVALANEITTRSMNDLGYESQRMPSSPNDKSKFLFRFPSLHQHTHQAQQQSSDGDHRDALAKQERRNFSEEANSVPDIQESLSEESKLAYSSLIEQPTLSSSLISHMAQDATGMHKPHTSATVPKPSSRLDSNFSSLRIGRSSGSEALAKSSESCEGGEVKSEQPLPPRATKPKLVDKPRHIRKHPLVIPNEAPHPKKDTETVYVNMHCHLEANIETFDRKVHYQNIESGVDVCDGVDRTVRDTNPFKSGAGASANPFNCFGNTFNGGLKDTENSNEQVFEEGSLVKDCTDHVSVEDLLEFADQKPCGRQRGVESDEVRIMSKVLKQQVSPEECLELLELCDWSVHSAIKVARVRLAAGDVTLAAAGAALAAAAGDVLKAAASLLPTNSR